MEKDTTLKAFPQAFMKKYALYILLIAYLLVKLKHGSGS